MLLILSSSGVRPKCEHYAYWLCHSYEMWPHHWTQDVHWNLLQFLLHINTEMFSLLLVICRYGLNELQFRVSLPSVSLVLAKLSLEESGSPDLFFLWTFWGFARVFGEPARPFLLLLLVVQILLLCTDILRLGIFLASSKFALLLVTFWRTFSQMRAAQSCSSLFELQHTKRLFSAGEYHFNTLLWTRNTWKNKHIKH